ncbi:hypothetical protein [Ruegeria lacuscaerulensis]|nr:hypothetical protein [Ruegeria lacuscaerulensis]
MLYLTVTSFLIGLATAGTAQMAPTALEIEAYSGLFKAAQKGDVAAIQ